MIGPAYNSIKNAARSVSGVSDTMLHVVLGLGIYVLVAVILRRGWRSPLPLAAVFVIEVLNEIGDYIIHDSWRWPSPIVDGFNTVALPICIFVAAHLVARAQVRVGARSATEGEQDMTTKYNVIVEGSDETLSHEFDGEPQINLTFENNGHVYRVVTRAHDEDTDTPTLHARLV